jgi:O-antigen/teichoic acid export membrane protein
MKSIQPTGEESVRRRYLVTLLTQFVQLAGSIVTAGVVPRALRPVDFGNYSFLMSTASTIRTFFDPSASQAFFTFSSQERRSGSLTRLYGLVILIQIAASFALISAVALAGRLDSIWPGQRLDHILLITVLDWMLFLALTLRQLGDSKGLTVHAQFINLAASVLNIAGVLVLDSIGRLNLYTFIALNMVSTMMIGIGLIRWLLVANGEITWKGRVREKLQEYVSRWWRYASPLLVWEYYKPLLAYLSIYLLQHWYGSVEQGYFALASKWSAIILVFTSSALSIFWREIAHAVANGERERAARIYQRFTYLLFFLSVVLCAWLSFGSSYLIKIMVGEEYTLAAPILAIMAFYPLQQTYGQINIAALKGAEKTVDVRNLGILISIPDLILTYLLLAPIDAPIPGLSLGALGVAIKMVIYGLLSVQSYEWMSHKTFALNYSSTLIRKLGVLVVVLIIATLTLWGSGNLMIDAGVTEIIALGGSSILYLVMIALIMIVKPELAGLTRSEVYDYFQRGYSILQKLLKLRRNDRSDS